MLVSTKFALIIRKVCFLCFKMSWRHDLWRYRSVILTNIVRQCWLLSTFLGYVERRSCGALDYTYCCYLCWSTMLQYVSSYCSNVDRRIPENGGLTNSLFTVKFLRGNLWETFERIALQSTASQITKHFVCITNKFFRKLRTKSFASYEQILRRILFVLQRNMFVTQEKCFVTAKKTVRITMP